MAENNVFLLFPETEPTCQFIESNEPFQFHEVVFISFINDLNDIVHSIKLEDFEGYYDSQNIENFLTHFQSLEDLYPAAPFSLLRVTLKDWENWREKIQQSSDKIYKIFKQTISDNTFCEIAERSLVKVDDGFPLLNHHAVKDSVIISVVVNSHSKVSIEKLKGLEKTKKWFARNRIPQRNFHVIPKHGEKRQDIRIISGERISPLRCSKQEAQDLLHTAIGHSLKELFEYDPKHNEIIVFKYENNPAQNMYHGFHVPKESPEIPNEIRMKLLS